MMFLPMLLIWIRAPLQFPPPMRWGLLMVFLSTACAIPAAEPNPSPDDGFDAYAAAAEAESTRTRSTTETKHQLRREGEMIVRQPGRFVEVGRRWLFTSEEARLHVRVLENLALQRIDQAMRQNAEDNQWTVTGVLTEFGDENYLLLRAVVRSPRGTVDAGQSPSERRGAPGAIPDRPTETEAGRSQAF